MRRASANMWWIIIGAVIALVVMIILMVMFTGKSGKLEAGLSGCESKGGICVPNSDNKGCPKSSLSATTFDCKSTSELCCLGNPKEADPNVGTSSDDCITVTATNGKIYCR
jgi:hypothetical protein